MDSDDFEILDPPPAAQAFVRRCLYTNRRLSRPLVMEPKSTGYTYFSNAFGTSPGDTWSVDGRPSARRSRWYIAGHIVDQKVAVNFPEVAQSIFCELTATAPWRVFGLRGHELVGTAIPLTDVPGGFEEVARRHFVAGPEATREVHLREVGSFFAGLANLARPGDEIVERAVVILERANGAVAVSEICRELGVNERLLRRRFTEVVGLSPKFFGQILQINWVIGLLYFNDSASLTQIAQDAGFYDQAHFNHAMRRFFQEGPKAFLKSNHVAFKAFLGASRRFGPKAAIEAPGHAPSSSQLSKPNDIR